MQTKLTLTKSKPAPQVSETEQAKALIKKLNQPLTKKAQHDLIEQTLVLAKTLIDTNKHADASNLLECAFTNTQANDAQLTRLFRLLLDAFDAEDNISQIIAYAPPALEHYERTNNLREKAHVHKILGFAYTFLYVFHEALENLTLAVNIYKQLNDPMGLANTYMAIGWASHRTKHYQKALQYFEAVKTITEQHNDKQFAGRAIGNIGNVYGAQGQHEKAIEYHKLALQNLHDNPFYRSLGYGNISSEYYRLEQYDKAIEYLKKALKELEFCQNATHEAWLHLQYGKALTEVRPDDAEPYLLHAIDVVTEKGIIEYVSEAHESLAKLYEKQGRCAEALRHYKCYAELEIKQLRDMNEKRTQALSVHLEVSRLEHESERYKQQTVELSSTIEELEELSSRDGLTGLYNRRYLDAKLANAFAQRQQTNQAFTVLIADIDNFKTVNDTFSHSTGDAVLKEVARIFNDTTWGSDCVARYGGEEFVVLFQDTTLVKARTVAEKIRQKIEAFPWETVHPDLSITISMGLSDNPNATDYQSVLALADKNLYLAKHNGKNQVRG